MSLMCSAACAGESTPPASTPPPAQAATPLRAAKSPPATTAPPAQPPQTPAAAPQPASAPASLASADGEQPGVRVEIQELKRTEGGTVTLKLAFINTSGRNIFNLGGFDEINLIDAVGKKKYFVAEDSAGKCLCSGPLVNFEADARANVWAKFPAPPEDVQKIAIVVPKFPPLEGIPISQ
jgi:hypothetical protein